MNKERWNKNRDIVSDIFVHHDVASEMKAFKPGVEIRLETDHGKFFISFWDLNGFLFNISKNNVYKLAISSAHLIKGVIFCKHCSVYTFQDDKKYFADIQKSRKV